MVGNAIRLNFEQVVLFRQKVNENERKLVFTGFYFG